MSYFSTLARNASRFARNVANERNGASSVLGFLGSTRTRTHDQSFKRFHSFEARQPSKGAIFPSSFLLIGAATLTYYLNSQKASADEKKAPVELKNIFNEIESKSNNFASGKSNQQGLKLKFLHDEESKEVFTKFTTSNSHVGNGNTVHNGLVCTVIDEVAFWTVFARYQKIPLIMKIETEFKIPVRPNVPLEVRGRVETIRGKNIVVRAIVLDPKGQILATSKVTLLLAKQDTTKSILGITSKSYDAFFDE